MSFRANYSDESLSEIVASILENYSVEQLQLLYSTFCWQDTVLPEAETRRNNLSAELISSLKSGHASALRSAADNIHRWGFGRGISAAFGESLTFWSDLQATLTAFEGNKGADLLKCVAPLTRLLSHKGLGIATVSKWVCFVDQAKFAIFDSRVSISLRNVEIAGHRAFPIVGRRRSGARLVWTASSQLGSPMRAARAYVDYLQVMGILGNMIRGMTVAQIEMALFMAGDVWRTEGDELKPLLSGMWE